MSTTKTKIITIQIHQNTLPKDEAKVAFELVDKPNHFEEGTYIAEEQMFFVNESDFYYVDDVNRWFYLNEDSHAS